MNFIINYVCVYSYNIISFNFITVSIYLRLIRNCHAYKIRDLSKLINARKNCTTNKGKKREEKREEREEREERERNLCLTVVGSCMHCIDSIFCIENAPAFVCVFCSRKVVDN